MPARAAFDAPAVPARRKGGGETARGRFFKAPPVAFFWAVVVFAAVSAALGARAEAAAPAPFTARAERPFGGWISVELAGEAARSAARREAARLAAPFLLKLPEVVLVFGEEPPDLAARFLLEAAGEPRERVAAGAADADRVLALEWDFRLDGGERARQKLSLLLSAPALQENYHLALQLEADALAGYDAAARGLLAASPGGGSASAWEEAAAWHNALRAAGLYLEILPRLYEEGGLSPDLLEPLEKINRLHPDNYLFLSELGRFYLWLERSGQAGRALDAALRLNPAFDQAYAHRGALWLLLHKPSLALADFDRAIGLAAGRPDLEAVYLHGRAVVWKALGNNAGMCADLRRSCLLGQCAAYEWAAESRECP